MPLRLSPAVVVGIVLIVLVPVLNLSLSAAHWSTRIFRLANSFRVDHDKVEAHGLNIRHQNELLYTFGDVSYFSPLHVPVISLHYLRFYNGRHSSMAKFPSTVVRVPIDEPVLRPDRLREVIDNALATDDVLTPGWLTTLFLLPDVSNPDDTASMTFIDKDSFVMLQNDLGVQRVFVDPSFALPRSLSLRGLDVEVNRLFPPVSFPISMNGPFLGSSTQDRDKVDLWPVYRLYSDTFRSFLFGLYKLPLSHVSAENGATYEAFRHLDDHGYILIPVPSRLSSSGPHNGVRGQRIGVKDLYDIKGVPTSAGSRTYGELYGPANFSAASILKLERLGGVLVGKTKSASFALGSEENSIEEQYPFSARSDLWQSCAGSSSGSGCAMGAYEWLDVTLGTDSGGSVRGPAARVGVYGNRPSFGTISLDGMIPLTQNADTAGAMGRDPRKLNNFLRSWYAGTKILHPYTRLPTTLYVPRAYLKQESKVAQNLIDTFISDVEDKLSMQVKEIDLDKIMTEQGYTRDRIREMESNDMEATVWWSWVENGKQFKRDYRGVNQGRSPPVDPLPRKLWALAERKGSWDKFDRSIREVAKFGEWFNKEILPPHNGTCGEGIFIYEFTGGRNELYREDALNHFHEATRPGNTSISGKALCSYAGCSDITIPIGQAPFQSLVSNMEEQRPVTISLVARPGCDFMLYDFVDKLAEVGLIKEVKTGRTAY